MALFEAKSSALVTLQDLRPSSPFFKQGKSLRIIGTLNAVVSHYADRNFDNVKRRVDFDQLEESGNSSYRSIKPLILEAPKLLKSWREVSLLQEYSLETGLATVIDGSDILKVSIEQLKDLKFQVGSVYQFIGELLIQPDNKGVLQARVGRNVDGIDLNLYHQSLLLLRQFQANHLNNSAT